MLNNLSLSNQSIGYNDGQSMCKAYNATLQAECEGKYFYIFSFDELNNLIPWFNYPLEKGSIHYTKNNDMFWKSNDSLGGNTITATHQASVSLTSTFVFFSLFPLPPQLT